MANQYEPYESREQNQEPQEKRHNAGKFQAGSERAREAGRKGGQASRGGGRRSE